MSKSPSDKFEQGCDILIDNITTGKHGCECDVYLAVKLSQEFKVSTSVTSKVKAALESVSRELVELQNNTRLEKSEKMLDLLYLQGKISALTSLQNGLKSCTEI